MFLSTPLFVVSLADKIRYYTSMVQFDEDKQNEKLAQMRIREGEDLARILSQKYGLPYNDLSIAPVNLDALRMLPENVAREANMATFNLVNKDLSVAILSPQYEKTQEVLDDLKNKHFNIEVFMVSERSLELAWEKI